MIALALLLAAAPPLPALTGRVVDNAALLPSAAEARLAGRLARYEQRTHHQFVVVTVPSLGGETIEAFGKRLGNGWGIGRKGIDDGLLMIVAPNERKVRIAVGHGLERRLPDAAAAAIIAHDLVPAFAKGDFAGGIERGADAVMAAVPD